MICTKQAEITPAAAPKARCPAKNPIASKKPKLISDNK